MKYSLTLALLTLITVQSSAQYIKMAINFSKPEQPVRSGKPLKIIEIYRSRLFGSKFINRKEITYDWSARKISLKSYDKKGTLIHEYETVLDTSLQRVVFGVNINYKPKGILRDSFWLTYDANGILTRMVSSLYGQQSIADFKSDAGGLPIEAQVTNGKEEIITLEKAVYHPEENYYVNSQSSDRVVRKLIPDTQRLETNKFSPRLDEKMLFNDQGDMTYHKFRSKNNRPGPEYENEYEYDNRGNWIKKTAYIIDRKTGKRKRIGRSERVITYQ